MPKISAGLIALALVAACGPRAAPPPAPPPAPPAAARDGRAADSARAEAARAAARTVRPEPPALPRAATRTDTLPTRGLRAPLRICAGGDITLGTNLDTAWARVASARLQTRFRQRDDPATLLAPLRGLLTDAELVLVNVESAIGEGPAPSKCSARSTNCFAFRAPPSSASALRSLRTSGTVIGNIANNHARDAGREGRDSTIAALARAFDRYPAVIVTMHLGAEGRDAQRTADSGERYLGIDRGNPVAFADAAVRGGAALVIGHGPHVLRAVEWRERGALIAYSLGNLVTYGPFRLREPANRGAVLCTTLDQRGRPRDAELRATRQLVPGVMRPDRSARAVALVDSLGRLDFPATGARARARGRLEARAMPGGASSGVAPR